MDLYEEIVKILGSKANAARTLGIPYRTFQYWSNEQDKGPKYRDVLLRALIYALMNANKKELEWVLKGEGEE